MLLISITLSIIGLVPLVAVILEKRFGIPHLRGKLDNYIALFLLITIIDSFVSMIYARQIGQKVLFSYNLIFAIAGSIFLFLAYGPLQRYLDNSVKT